MDISEQYHQRLKAMLGKRFAESPIVLNDIYPRVAQRKVIDFRYKGVECLLGFSDEEGKLVFTMELETPRKKGLVEKMQEENLSAKKIEEVSRYLTRPHKESVTDSQTEKTHYSVHCRAKQNLANLDPQKNPEDADRLITDIWVYLMRTPIGLATGMLK